MFDTWKQSVLGIGLDVDGVEQNQCVDTAKSWANAIFAGIGAKWQETLGYGNAKDMYANANPKYFEKVLNDHRDVNQVPPRGAIAVFAAQDKVQRAKGYSSKYDNPYGHCLVVDEANQQGMWGVQQDGSISQGKVTRVWRDWRYTECIGWLIPRDPASLAPPVLPPIPVINGAPQVSTNVVGRILWLKPHVDKWRIYPLNVVPKIGNEKNFVRPSQFGGLAYKIIGVTGYPQTVVIQTEMFGTVAIYVDSDAEVR